MKKDSIKNRRINDEVMRSLSDIIRNEMKDPRVSPFTSILQVEVAPDLKTCKVWFTVLGSPEDGKRTLEGLRSAHGFIRSALARDVNLRNTPELTFLLDDSIAYGVEMSKKIDEVIAADREAEAARGEEETGEEAGEETRGEDTN
ncbi:MAG: 30S ribosome-binding factor RbfA [Lachnospiraceae bacterium]|jgi:ribosome-binding factor A|nr:30S ribosome-binding factor RbfA [Lachnospiraceae bacterium]